MVLDNAFGSGSFPLSAALEDRKFIGIELNQNAATFKSNSVDWIEVARQRFDSLGIDVQVIRSEVSNGSS